ncbi:hypothetical protein RQP46_000343 [Phenoliferia psychrophenolica]
MSSVKGPAYTRLNSDYLPTSTPPSRSSSPALPVSDQYAYSTSLRRSEPDSSIHIGIGGGQSGYGQPSSARHDQPGGGAGPGHASAGPGGYNHHPFAHTTSPVTPSSHYATQTIDAVCSALSTNPTNGLASATVPAIRELSGPNEFEVAAKDPVWKKFAGQFYESPLILLLLGSAAISAVVGNYDDAASIIGAIVIVVTVGFVQEQRSEKSLDALNKLVPHYCHLIRDGNKTTQLANVLVPGDLITFSTGDRIPADIRLTAAHHLDIDESTLTGETHPARKQVDAIIDGNVGVGGLPISERRNIGFMGTLVRNGRGEGIVVGTGVQSEFGVVFAMMQEIGDRKTPLQLSMDELAKKLSAISFGVIGIICLIGVIQKRSWLEMFTIGVSLAVAAIPEGLPIVVTVTLALGVLRMSKRKAIVKKLPSVETLGSVSVICSDKTGTLTTNVMTVTKAYTVDDGVFDIDVGPPMLTPDDARSRLFLIGNICNSSYTDRGRKNVGQATEVALMNVLPVVGLRDQREFFTRKLEVPFTSEHKFQSISGTFTNQPADRETTYLSGAIEVVLSKCRFYLRADHATAALDAGTYNLVLAKATELASSGLRVIGMASGPDPDALVFAGFQAMMDPPRKGVDKAIAQLSAGGIQVVMITGDSEQTALSIARQLGIRVNPGSSGCLLGKDIDLLSQRQLTDRIAGVSVFARTTPRHKMAIIEAFQSRGAVVAMTGDGVNDAPALKMADIGVAMGRGGTDVAKEAADVILVDDNFATLLPAVEEGKSIFLNIQNFLVFQLSTAVSALSLITLSTALGLPNPLNAMQILWINVIMDGPPAQSLGVDPVNRDIMRRPPRPKNTPILSRRLLQRVAFSAIVIVSGVLFVLARELGDGSMASRDQTMTFTSFVFLDLASALQNRGLNVPLLFGAPNKLLLLTVSISFLAQLSLIYVPFLQSVFQTEALSFRDFSVLLTIAGSRAAGQDVDLPSLAFPSRAFGQRCGDKIRLVRDATVHANKQRVYLHHHFFPFILCRLDESFNFPAGDRRLSLAADFGPQPAGGALSSRVHNGADSYYVLNDIICINVCHIDSEWKLCPLAPRPHHGFGHRPQSPAATDFKFRIREALAAAVRLTSCGVSVGNPLSLEPEVGVFKATNWDTHDYALYAAREYGLKVILPLTDDYNYYTGGKYTFLNWRNVSIANKGAEFYTNEQVVTDYLAYVYQFLTRINSYTGVIYGDDPTIAAFETGNELGAYMGKEGYPPAVWTYRVAAMMKAFAPRILVLDGSDGFWNYTTHLASPSVNVTLVDILSDHMYPPNIGYLSTEVGIAQTASKPIFIGEWDWTGENGGNSVDEFVQYLESTPSIIGDMTWSLFTRDQQCCNFVQHDDGYSMYYPNGNTPALQTNILKVVQHNYRYV